MIASFYNLDSRWFPIKKRNVEVKPIKIKLYIFCPESRLNYASHQLNTMNQLLKHLNDSAKLKNALILLRSICLNM